jgi:hypothetical protein
MGRTLASELVRVLEETLKELEATVEELRVAQERLLEQNRELKEARADLDRESVRPSSSGRVLTVNEAQPGTLRWLVRRAAVVETPALVTAN